MLIQTHAGAHTHMLTHTQTCTHAHTQTHTQTHKHKYTELLDISNFEKPGVKLTKKRIFKNGDNLELLPYVRYV